ncbi:MAG: GNAT family N-acetyltransferase [Rhodobacteraceae bacterium]|nr:GNAT family N-acetyltransferase [Paracoccaceae bacterium]
MRMLRKGRYIARLAETPAEVEKAQHLRHFCFFGGEGLDADHFDAICRHLLVEDAAGRLLGCCRVLLLPDAGQIGRSYSAQVYGLSRLARFPGPVAEVGRFCLHPEARDPEILRLAWAALTRIVDQTGTRLLFGCSSFPGTDPEAHAESLALLAQRHLGPDDWRPSVKAAQSVPLPGGGPVDPRHALAGLPPLLRSYLAMGGWVSDHAVIDRGLGTLHVFTGLEVARVPPSRARLLRELAAEGAAPVDEGASGL